MSSIKQVQDLEKQMDRVRRENSSLRRMLNERDGQMDIDIEGVEQAPVQIPDIGSEPKRRKRAAPHHDPARARANLRTFSKGIIKPPAPYRQAPESVLFEPPLPQIPAKQLVDSLLRSYYGAVHIMLPLLHWPTLQHEVEELYQPGGLQRAPASWLSLFFAILATGSLFSNDAHPERTYRASDFLELSRNLTDPWNNDFVLDNVRTLFLTSLALNELNLKSAAWTWLGSAVRAAQDMGLHLETGPRSRVEADMRRRVWWAIYISDRTMSLESGRPSSIHDADCDVALPEPIDDHFLHAEGPVHPLNAEPLTHSIHVIINVVRSIPALTQAFMTCPIAPTRLSTFDAHFAACQRAFPAACDPSSSLPIPPHMLMPIAYLLNARMLLHRHNLAPICPPEVRTVAIEQCTHTALETAYLIARTNASLGDTATALLTTHIFRCALFLTLTGYHEHAATCIRAMKSIDARRDVAVPCGRFLSFFISTVASKRAELASFLPRSVPPQGFPQQRAPGPSIQESLIRDEELLAYVSADLQGGAETGWVWAGAERDPVAGPAPAGGGLTRTENRTGLSTEELQDWGGWDRLDGLLRGLTSGNWSPVPTYARQSLPPQSLQQTLPPIKMEQGPPIPRSSTTGPGSSGNSPAPGAASRNTERISIANII
jgi:hypothetical protein